MFKQKRRHRPPISRKTAVFGKSRKGPGKLVSVLLSLLAVIALGVFVFSLVNIISITKEYNEGESEYSDIFQDSIMPDIRSEYLRVNYDKLKNVNGDFAAWIEIPGTNISYPVVFPADNDVYLHTTFNRNYNSAGTIFLDYRSDPSFLQRNTILYGHNMKNGSMFADLKDLLDKAFWEENNEVRIYTSSGINIYTVFSAYRASVEDECYTFGFESDDSYQQWLNSVQRKSNYSTGLTLDKQDKVILLSTCVSGGADTENFRNVVLAALTDAVPNPI